MSNNLRARRARFYGGNMECNHDCSSCASANCGERKEEKKKNGGCRVKKVIAVVSGKGGVGKSLVSALTASALAKDGGKVAVLDADVTGPSMGKVFGVGGKAYGNGEMIVPAMTRKGSKLISVNMMLEHDDDPVIWRGPLIAGMVEQFWTDVDWGDVDYMVVDMPPGTGDVPLTVFQSLPVDGILIVTSPQELVSMIVAKALKMAKMMNVPVLGVVENMSYFVCDGCGKKHFIFGESKAEEVCQQYGVRLLTRLPINPALAKLCDDGRIEDAESPEIAPVVEAVKKATKRERV